MESSEKIHWTDVMCGDDDGDMQPAPCFDLTFDAVTAAADVVGAHLPTTPLQTHPLLDQVLDRPVLVKHENVQPTGAFKVRGGVHLSATLTPGERAHGLVTCSTGNHAQSVAYGARLAGVPATIVMPASAPASKVAAVRALGAEVVLVGANLGEAGEHARARAVATGASFVCPTDPRIVLGHATAYVELFGASPDLDVVFVPIGSGTGAAGACLVRDALAPKCRIVGVQSSAAPAGWHSWRTGRIEAAPATTRAAGLATTTGYPRTQDVLRGRLDDFVLVSDDDIDAAARLLATCAHTLAEGAGAASLAGAMGSTEGGRTAVICTGGNASADEIVRLAGAVAAA